MNMKRFRQVLAYIEAHPDEWDQHQPNSIRENGCGCFGAHVRRIWGGDDDSAMDPLNAIRIHLSTSRAEAAWIWSTARTLDDFRTFARRPFA